MTKFHTISIMLLFLIGCDSNSAKNKASQIDTSEVAKSIAIYESGKNLFTRFCIKCHHTPDSREKDQYMFDNLFERLPSPQENYFIKFIQDSKELKKSGDKYAIGVSKEWDSNYDHKFKDRLSIDDFANLILYIKLATKSKSH